MKYKLIFIVLIICSKLLNAEGVVVFDPQSIIALKEQLKHLKEQVESAKILIDSVTGKKLEQITTPVDDNIPVSWKDMYADTEVSIVKAKNFEENYSKTLLKTYNVMRNNYNQAKTRVINIQRLMVTALSVKTIKGSLDLQNLIAIEQLALQQNANQMQQLQMMLEKERDLAIRRNQLHHSCSHEQSIEERGTAKEHGWKMSEECKKFLRGQDVHENTTENTNNNNKGKNTDRITEIKDKNGKVIEIRQGGTISWRNNNPGNIKCGDYAKSKGATGCSGGFAVFTDKKTGDKAREDLIFKGENYINKNLEQMIKRYAPKKENNVEAYVNSVKKSGVDINKKMKDMNASERQKILDAMQKHEGWKEGKIKYPNSKGK